MVQKLMMKILNLKLGILLEYQNLKTFLQRGYVPNGSEEVFLNSKVKKTVPWIYVNSDIKGEEIVVMFCEEEVKCST